MNKELIELLKQGTHCIEMPDNPTKEDVELLNEITNGDWHIIQKYHGYWCSFKEIDTLIPIPLSSFLDTPKMISVEAVKDWVEQNTTHKAQDGYVIADNLLTFLNEIK